MLYDPARYWNEVVSGTLDLATVGHPALGAYNHVAYRLRRRAFERALARISFTSDLNVFEAAFGVGFYLRLWAARGVRHVAGMDLSRAAVAKAQVLFPDYQLVEGNLAEPLPFPSCSFDLVTAVDVLYHIVDDDQWKQALMNLGGLVKPGGCLLWTDKFPAQVPYQRFASVRRRPLEWYREKLEEQGFEIMFLTPVMVFMDDPIPDSAAPGLGALCAFQWRILHKFIRLLGRIPRVRDAVATAIAYAQYPFERIALAQVRRSPSLELVVARRGP